MDYTKLTEARLTQFESPDFLDQFERRVLSAEDRPTVVEMAEYIRYLKSQIRIQKTMAEAQKLSAKLTDQGFDQFVNAVLDLAIKHRPSA
jgi:hypothetical protein